MKPTLSVRTVHGSRRAVRASSAVLVIAAIVLAAGCATEPAATPAPDTTKYTLENTDRFVALDRVPVSCTGLMDHPLADGRMEVVANVKNRASHAVTLQANCVFRDESGANLVEETAWQTVSVPENTTVTVRFAAANAAARKYSVRVREAR